MHSSFKKSYTNYRFKGLLLTVNISFDDLLKCSSFSFGVSILLLRESQEFSSQNKYSHYSEISKFFIVSLHFAEMILLGMWKNRKSIFHALMDYNFIQKVLQAKFTYITFPTLVKV